jgi:hypothetical protein
MSLGLINLNLTVVAASKLVWAILQLRRSPLGVFRSVTGIQQSKVIQLDV